MGLAHEITANGLTYSVVDDIRAVYSAIIVGLVREDVTGRPLPVPVRIDGTPPGSLLKTAEDGLYVLAGYPERVFGGSSPAAHVVTFTIRADRYRPQTLSVIVPAGATAPVQAPEVSLRPLPVRLQGRVMSTAGIQPPIGGARVTSVDDPNPPSPLVEHPVLLRETVQFAHPVNTVVRPRTLAPAGAARQLAFAAAAADVTVTLSDRTGLAAGGILRFGGAETARFRRILSLAPLPANPALPGKVTLTGMLGATYLDGSPVQPMTAGLPSAPAHMTRDADPGDGILMLDTLLTDETVEINDPAALEYVAVGALTGTDGYYQSDGIGRTRTLFLLAAHAGFQAMPTPLAWAIDYAQPAGIVDFRLSP